MKDKAEKKKLSFRETIRDRVEAVPAALQLRMARTNGDSSSASALGFLFGVTNGCLPLVLQKVTSTIFHGGHAKREDADSSLRATQCRRIDKVDRLHLPAHSRGHDRAQPDELRQRLLHELGQ